MVISGSEFLELASEDKNTSFLGVIGNPISHSRSPELHSFIYSELDLKAKYFALSFETDDSLLNFLKESEKLPNNPGFNITIPFKETVFRKFNSPQLQTIGAVNTLVKSDGKFLGNNTDWIGFVDPIRQLSIKSAVILGWGGAAKGVVFGLRSVWPECKITIISRKKHDNLPGINWVLSDYSDLNQAIKPTDLIVNSTPLGMKGKQDNFSDHFLSRLPETNFAYDIIYTPAETRFLTFFKSKSVPVQNGLAMFIGQALAAHEFWFGHLDPQRKKDLSNSLAKLLQP